MNKKYISRKTVNHYPLIYINSSEHQVSVRRKRKRTLKNFKLKSNRYRRDGGMVYYCKDIYHPVFYKQPFWLYRKYLIHYVYNTQSCMKCGATDRVLHIDHILPRSKFPQHSFNLHNLQILCVKCNKEKSNISHKDYRRKHHRLALIEYLERNFLDDCGVAREVSAVNIIPLPKPKINKKPKLSKWARKQKKKQHKALKKEAKPWLIPEDKKISKPQTLGVTFD